MSRPATMLMAAALGAAAFASTARAAVCDGDPAALRGAAARLVELGPRPDSSDAAARAVAQIDRSLRALDLAPRSQRIGAIDVPEIAVGSWVIRRGGARRSSSDNLWVRFGGPGPARLFMAHYDTVGGSPGAVDNAGAVAVLLDLARCLAAEPPAVPVVLAFTGAEEIGLLGARALLRDGALGDLELAVSLDLVGHQRPLAFNGVSALWTERRLEWLARRVADSGAGAYVALLHRLVSRLAPQLERSDHGPFTAAGVPALHLYGRGPGRIYLGYHSPLDTAGQLDGAALADARDLAAAIAYAGEPLPDPGGGLGMWIDHPLGAAVISHAVVVAVEIALAIAAIALVALALRRRRGSRSGAGLGAALGLYALSWGAATAALALEQTGGDRLSILLSLPRYWAASLAIAGAVFGLALLAVARRWPLVGGARYHIAAAAIAAVAGVALLVPGALELAWLPLSCAALFSLGAFFIHRPPIALATSAVGAALGLLPAAPSLLREAVFHGFYPVVVPLPATLALLVLPPWLALVGALRATLSTPRDRRVLAVVAAALALLLFAGLGLLFFPSPPCPAEAIALYGHACPLAP